MKRCFVILLLMLPLFSLTEGFLRLRTSTWGRCYFPQASSWRGSSRAKNVVTGRPIMSALSLEEIEQLRAGEIKERLAKLQVSTRGIMEKSELAKLLFSKQPLVPPTCEVPLLDVPFYDVPFPQLASEQGKSFLGVDLVIEGAMYRFVVDSGASMNLLKKSVASKAGLNRVITDANTIGMGGSGTIAASVCTVDDVFVGGPSSRGEVSRVRGLQFAILDNPNVLPASSDGLLGLTFLARLPGIPYFDFAAKVLRFGGSSDPPSSSRFASIATRQIFSGLLVCDINFNGVTSETVTGMIDCGSSYTILNSRAVQVATRGAITSLDQLPTSPQQVAGIDGRPVRLRVLTLPAGVQIGDFSSSKEITLYAADIEGLAAIGLPHTRPACLLGLDILAGGGSSTSKRIGCLGLDLRRNKMYLQRDAA